MYSKAALASVALGASCAWAAQNSRTYGIGYFWDSPLVEARMDPIISPGQISTHVHTVVGGDGFSISMDNNAASNSQCTQSRVDGDKSNYWFPALYHHNTDGTFTKVELDYVKAYYFFEATDDEIVPFPPGFRMISGNPFYRTPVHTPWSDNIDPNAGPVQPTSFVCPQSGTSNAWNSTMSTSTGQGPNLPDQMCNGEYSPLRYNVHFPSCINTNVPFTDFMSNTAWASSAGTTGGKTNCPQGYTHVPHLFVEAYWNTMEFTDWTPGQGQQPFVLAMGDPLGYGLHADFISGWDTDVLSNLIATCNAGAHGDGLDSCPNVQAHGDTPTSCRVASANPTEVVNGTLPALPGCNPVQWGPEPAVLCDCSSGSPVCNGSSGSSTVPPSTNSNGTSSVSASSSAPAGASTPVASAASTSVAASASQASSAQGNAPWPSQPAHSGGDGTPKNGSGDDGDDDTCEPDESGSTSQPMPTPDTMGRRHARHLDFHKGMHERSW